MIDLTGRVALITGASSGIGAGCSMALVEYGAIVIGFARRIDRLREIEEELANKSGVFKGIECDVLEVSKIKEKIECVYSEYKRIDILMNNAGLSRHGPVLNGDIEDFQLTLDTNAKSVFSTTISALPFLVKTADISPFGTDIIMISSLLARLIRPGRAAYSASKAAVNAFSESLRQELHGKNVRISMLEPGLVDTEIATHVRNKQEYEEGLEYRRNIEILSVDDIVRCVLFIINQPKNINITELVIRPTQQW